ncbi:DDE_Tnp_1-associated [Nitrosomonas sp. Nm51]|uniref:Druantia anti-phage system protein DruA n=1 Tax=Nitrosomonas sp. Nm51 TaxID=133720 RepID=UPI0008B127B7|nr:Druantia anti-phage system protein DruA [Nitrosomonas sp. Nm51]SER09461.1 DDE_Tnp_1-associated [Nitrosomonas sp. Nm51]
MKINLGQLSTRPVRKVEEPRYRELMQQYHYLGDLAKIGHTLWYVATHGDEWAALLSFSAAAWKCGVRDRWIGWDFRHQYDRLKLIANNSRFLILPEWHYPNLGSKALSLCHQRIAGDWRIHFGQSLLLLETFVDPSRFHGTVYRAANWTCLGLTRGYSRTRDGYSTVATSPKLVFTLPVQRDARAQLSRFTLNPIYRTGAPKIMLTVQQMRTLPDFFNDIPDPRRAEGKRHRLSVVLGIAAGATLCGMRGYKAIAAWAKDLKPKARERFGCRRENKKYVVPSESIIRDVLVRVDPVKLDLALQQWNAAFAKEDQSLAIDGKTMCSAIDEAGRQTHIMSVVGHETALCLTQKKSALCP